MIRASGRPEYHPDDPQRYIMLAQDPDHVQYSETDWLRQNFALICKKCASKRVVVCDDQAEGTLNIHLVCEDCGNHASVFCLDMDD